MNDQIPVKFYPDSRLDTANAALYLGMTKSALAHFRCKGKGPRFVKIGKRIFYFQVAIDEWIISLGQLTETKKNQKSKATVAV